MPVIAYFPFLTPGYDNSFAGDQASRYTEVRLYPSAQCAIYRAISPKIELLLCWAHRALGTAQAQDSSHEANEPSGWHL